MKIMKYNQLINQARVDGQMTDKKLNAALEQLSCDLMKVENENPELKKNVTKQSDLSEVVNILLKAGALGDITQIGVKQTKTTEVALVDSKGNASSVVMDDEE